MDEKVRTSMPMKSDEEPATILTTNSSSSSDTSKKSKGAFSQISRELSEKDLNEPGTQRLILNELDKYEECKLDLEFYRANYHKLETKCAIYRERLKSQTINEILSSTMLAAGPALMTIAPSIQDAAGEWFYLSTIVLVLGIIILLAGILAKIFQHLNNYGSKNTEH